MTLVRALFRVIEWSCITGTIPAEQSPNKGHARMVDDLRFKVDRFAILSVKPYAAGIPPPEHEQTRSDAIPPTID
ncbi:hypothetical protein [Caballeronia pedi]|uniref:hypothetical protein n=1 Tax=Caballeronia pedi TaxID=1777141 RepID=UPI00117804D9|nr:hypothetical protein [Caballeronia pedi]